MNKLERDFKISKHHWISETQNCTIGLYFVLGNKPSSVSLLQSHAIVFIESVCKERQISILHHNMQIKKIKMCNYIQ